MPIVVVLATLLGLILIGAPGPASAQPVAVPDTWGGDFWSRPCDSFGIGWARTEFSDKFLPFLRQQLRLGLEREDAIEMYYNASITSWLNATLDLQVIEPALTKHLGSSGRLEDTDTAVVAGLRLYVRF